MMKKVILLLFLSLSTVLFSSLKLEDLQWGMSYEEYLKVKDTDYKPPKRKNPSDELSNVISNYVGKGENLVIERAKPEEVKEYDVTFYGLKFNQVTLEFCDNKYCSWKGAYRPYDTDELISIIFTMAKKKSKGKGLVEYLDKKDYITLYSEDKSEDNYFTLESSVHRGNFSDLTIMFEFRGKNWFGFQENQKKLVQEKENERKQKAQKRAMDFREKIIGK